MNDPLKYCPRCGINKRLNNSTYCRECRNEYAREHRAKNKDKYLKQWREDYNKNKENPEFKKKLKGYAQKSWLKTKADPAKHEKRKKKSREYASKRRKAQPWVRAKRSARKRIYKYKQKNKIPKYERDISFGCDIQFFKTYIEGLWEKGMNWGNYSQSSNQDKYWELDHIKPVSSFDISDVNEAEKCNHYTNLQPMWSEDHKKKTNTERR